MPSEVPHVAIGVEELEQVAALDWRGLEEAHLGTWLLRAAAGFTGPGDIHEVQALAAAHRTDPTELTVRNDAEPDSAWLSAYKYRGATLPAHAREVLERAGSDTRLSFASLRTTASGDSEVLAVARGALARDWLGITAVTVADQHRRRGFGTHLMADLAGWGAQRGGRAIYLQVAADNTAALKLYERLGFHHHHDYRYRIGPLPAS